MRVLFVQPSIPVYRLAFFTYLSSKFGSSFSVLYSKGDMGSLTPSYEYAWSKCIGEVINIGFGFLWQNNLLRYKIKKNDIVVISGNPRYISSIIFILKVKLLGGKVAWWSHYRSSTSKTWRMNLRLRLMQIANGIVFYTEDEVNEYLSRRNKKEERPIIGLNNGVDINPIKIFRKKYNSNFRKFEILFLGRTSEKSSFNILLESLNYINLNNITLNVIGNDDHYFLITKKIILPKGVKINWYGKLIDERDISRIANRCRIFVYPGEVGLSLIHAMAYGLPCLVHSDRLKHMPEIAAFSKGNTGLTFCPGNSRHLAKILSNMISNTKLLNTMSKKCIKKIESEFNTKKMGQKFVKFIGEFE